MIKSKLEDIGICDIEIRVKVNINIFEMVLCRENFCMNILIPDLEKELNLKVNDKTKDMQYFYYRAMADEIVKSIKEIVDSGLYGEIIVNTNRSV